MPLDAPAGQTVELLRTLIRNACVNDGSPGSGQELRSARTLAAFLDGCGAELAIHEPVPGRGSLVARLEGTDPAAPTVALMGHTDVVPVTAERWTRDPFGAEVVDGEVWGRGAIDMLNLTAAMAVALRHLAEGPRPAATTVLLAVADEEAGGALGAGWLTEHAWDEVAADVCLTESGGIRTSTPAGPAVVVAAAEKGLSWRRITVSGTSSHGSRPYGADNAVVTAAEVVRRLATRRGGARITEHWRAWVTAQGWEPGLQAALLDPGRVLETVDGWPDPELRALAHAMTHTTFSPNVVRGGTATNVVPDEVVLDVDVRTLPGTTDDDVDDELSDLLGDLRPRVRWSAPVEARPASSSPVGTPWWDLLGELSREAHPDARILPRMVVGGTDASWYRSRGVPAYGAGLFSRRADLASFSARFHGPDERVDVESVGLSTAFFTEFVRRAA